MLHEQALSVEAYGPVSQVSFAGQRLLEAGYRPRVEALETLADRLPPQRA